MSDIAYILGDHWIAVAFIVAFNCRSFYCRYTISLLGTSRPDDSLFHVQVMRRVDAVMEIEKKRQRERERETERERHVERQAATISHCAMYGVRCARSAAIVTTVRCSIRNCMGQVLVP